MSAAQLLEQHDELCKSAKDLMTRKNHDYTSGSGDPFANFRGSMSLGIDPIIGVMLRMQDKMMRIRTFAEKGELKVKDEGVKDALVDLINYTVLMYGLIEEGKPQAITAEQTVTAINQRLYSGASAKEWLGKAFPAAGTAEAFSSIAGGTG